MPNVLDFISRVVPWGHDLVNLHWKIPGKPFMPGIPFNTPQDFLEYAMYANSRPKLYGDLYYCLSSQVKTGKTLPNGRVTAYRDHRNVGAFKAIWLDVDGYKSENGYGSLQEALDAIKRFVAKAGLPTPSALVCSGGGWHVYWISDKPLTEEEWRPYAQGLWSLVQTHGLKADAVTTDSVRVLRVPGTLNHKPDHTATVKLVALAPTDYAFKSTLYAIKAPEGQISHIKQSRAPRAAVCDESKFTQQAPVDGLETIGLARDFDQPLAWEPLGGPQGCPHVLDALQTHGAHYAQPLWHIDALLATFLKDGRRIFHRMSDGHKAYASDDADHMFDRKVNEREERALGWPSCSALEAAGCKSCQACPHRGKIRSPLNLTQAVEATPFLSSADGAGEHVAQTNVQGSAPATATDPGYMLFPRGYKLDDKGRICEGIQKTLMGRNGQPHIEWEPLLLTPICGRPYIVADPPTFNFTVKTNLNETRDVAIVLEALKRSTALGDAFFANQIIIAHGKEEACVKFFRPYVQILKESMEAHEALPYGWATKEGGDPVGFVYGGTMYKSDGTQRPCGKDDEFRKIYEPTGEEDVWFKAFDLVAEQHRPALEAIIAASLASPLLYMTGQNGGVIAAVGDTGANKSTAVDIGNAIWGKPILAKAVLAASNKGIVQQMTYLHNLPVYWDDIRNLDEGVKIVGQATEGQGGIHLKSDRSFAKNGTWQSILTLAVNGDVVGTLLKKSKTDAAQLYRVFQFDVPKPPKTVKTGRVPKSVAAPLQALLNYNYGRVGQRYARWLGSEPEAIRTAVLQKIDQFDAAVEAKDEERFWVCVCATLYAGAMLANQGLGAKFHLPELWTFLKDSFLALRERIESEHLTGGTEINTDKYLTGFFKHQGGNTLVSYDMIKERGAVKQFLRLISHPDWVRYPNAHINIHWVYDDKLLRLSKEAFRAYIEEQDTQPQFVLDGLKKHYGMYELPKVRLHAGLGGISGGREPVLMIPIKEGTWLMEELERMRPKPLIGEKDV